MKIKIRIPHGLDSYLSPVSLIGQDIVLENILVGYEAYWELEMWLVKTEDYKLKIQTEFKRLIMKTVNLLHVEVIIFGYIGLNKMHY